MNKIRFLLEFLLLFVGILFASCSKKEAMSPVPEIEFVSATPTTVQAFQDSIQFRISYKDGDGDLGDNNDSVQNVFLTDSRNNISYTYRLQELAPSGSKISIQGFVNIKLKRLGLLDENNNQETATFAIYIKDRAGNLSNTVTTSSILISK